MKIRKTTILGPVDSGSTKKKMDKKLKSILKSQIETYLQKKPHASDGKIIKWLYIGTDTLNAIKKRKPEKLCCLPEEEVCNVWVLC